MRFCRLVFLSAFMICVSLSAKAQYTSKSSSSGFTSKTPAPAAARQPQEKTGTNTYTNSTFSAGKSSYTNQGASTAEKSNTTPAAVNVRPAAAVQVRPTAPSAAAFRPRAQMTAETEDDSGDDLPSFDALEDNGKPKTQEQQKQLVQMLEEPKGDILIFISDFTIDDSSRIPICDWKVNVQNDSDLTIQALRFEYQLNEEKKIYVNMKNISAGSLKQISHSRVSTKCSAMKQRRLKSIDLKKCKIGDVTNQGCMKYIKFK